MEPALVDLARAQGGIFTTAQARRFGIGRAGRRALIEAREVVGLGRGVMALAETWPTDDGPIGEEARHRLRAQGGLLLYPDAELTGVSLLLSRGVAVWGIPLDVVDLARPVRQEVRTQQYRIRPYDDATRPRSPRAEEDGPTDEELVAAALVQVCLDHGVLAAICSADHALHNWFTDWECLERAVAAARGRAYSSRLATMMAWIDARSESVGESRLRVALTGLGYRVLVQVPIVENGVVIARADLGIDRTNCLVECDGKLKYRGADGHEAVWAEKKREDRIRRKGHVFERFIWVDLDRTKVIKARVEEALKLADARPSRFEADQLLRTRSPKPRPARAKSVPAPPPLSA